METLSVSDRRSAGISFLRDTKSIGELSELIVGAALVRAGYRVALPLGESQRYDLVIEKGGVFSRVQVKTGRLRNGVILFHPYSSHSHRKGVACKPYTDQIDFFGIYCTELGAVYLLPIADAARLSGTLRVRPTKNGQHSQVRWAHPYMLSAEAIPELVVGSEPIDGVTP